MEKKQEVERDYIWPYGLAAFLLGLGTLAITALSLSGPDVSYLRSQWTAWLALALATPAILAYAGGLTDGLVWRPVWRGFWTAGFLAFALHFFWAVYRTYDGDYGAVFLHQGTWFALPNFIAAAIWAVDAMAVWLPQKLSRPAIHWLHGFVWLWVTASFIVSTILRPDMGIMIAGYVFTAAVTMILLLRLRTVFGLASAKPPASGSLPADTAPAK